MCIRDSLKINHKFFAYEFINHGSYLGITEFCLSLSLKLRLFKFYADAVSYTHLFVLLVGLSGLEPPTSRLSGVRSNRLSYKPIFPAFRLFPQAFGGDNRDRTADPLLAKQVLSQLSYTPVYLGQDPEN